ncbi:helix-turn-helix protein [Bacillus oleivorans]|uniref:Helix-turn-helix protein n=1 Tax=Bacillus oleivorans TaxID=1448271 RepID=A0A285CXI1_9BACI|nr:helix-turn-helix transcriptional regulator [Bacillus oleivorans]SNX71768.1 helix-turn-helix protein [Bacillus oleivorans]
MHSIFDLRKNKGWTQEELGKKFRKKKAAEIICRWEKGKTAPSSQNLQELSEIFGVPAQKILIKRLTD